MPTIAILEAAPLGDVGAVILSYANARFPAKFHRNNLVNELVEPYAQGIGSHAGIAERARCVIAEAVGQLFSQNFMVDDGSPGVGSQHMVTRLGKSMRTRSDYESYAKASLLPAELLHEELARVVVPLFLAGHYDDAVSVAFKRIEIAVRKAASLGDDDYGVALMRKAFGANGPLTDSRAVKAEQEALRELFSGAIGFFKNPLSHREVCIDDARLAASRILLANELLSIVGSRVGRSN